MGISESQALKKLDEFLSKFPTYWEYRKECFLTSKEGKKEIAENAKRFIHLYTSAKPRYYIPHPSTIAAYALYVGCNMSEMPITQRDINKVKGEKKPSFKRIQDDATLHRKVIGIDFNYNYYFV